jgi:hypothetical protein
VKQLLRIDAYAAAAIFALGLLILMAASAFDGHILPRPSANAQTSYDKSAFYVELVVWFVTLLSGAALAAKLWARRKR